MFDHLLFSCITNFIPDLEKIKKLLAFSPNYYPYQGNQMLSSPVTPKVLNNIFVQFTYIINVGIHLVHLVKTILFVMFGHKSTPW